MKAAELKTRVEKRKRARPRIGGLSGTGEDGWIIELGADQRFVHWDWAWTSLSLSVEWLSLLSWASINEKMTKSKLLPSHH